MLPANPEGVAVRLRLTKSKQRWPEIRSLAIGLYFFICSVI